MVDFNLVHTPTVSLDLNINMVVYKYKKTVKWCNNDAANWVLSFGNVRSRPALLEFYDHLAMAFT